MVLAWSRDRDHAQQLFQYGVKSIIEESKLAVLTVCSLLKIDVQ